MTDCGDESPDRVTIARITRTQGRKGEVFAQILTDFPHRFEQLRIVFLQYPQGNFETLAVEHTWLHKGGVVLKLGGVSSIDAGESRIGCLIQVEEDGLIPLPEGTYYRFQLEGCLAIDEGGQQVGRVSGIEDHGVNTLLVLTTDEGSEILVPTAKEYLIQVDIEKKQMVVRLPQDLVHLNS